MATEPVSPTRHPITRTVSLDENEIEFTAMRERSSDPYRGAGAAGELLYIYCPKNDSPKLCTFSARL